VPLLSTAATPSAALRPPRDRIRRERERNAVLTTAICFYCKDGEVQLHVTTSEVGVPTRCACSKAANLNRSPLRLHRWGPNRRARVRPLQNLVEQESVALLDFPKVILGTWTQMLAMVAGAVPCHWRHNARTWCNRWWSTGGGHRKTDATVNHRVGIPFYGALPYCEGGKAPDSSDLSFENRIYRI
jgi:hypothetical protein